MVKYDNNHWQLLYELRERASMYMMKLERAGIKPYVYGSLARGDTSSSSDIDIIVPDIVSSYKIEVALEGKGIRKELVQATPSSVLKGHFHLEDGIVVSFPLFRMMSREREFYKWGGQIDLQGLRNRHRVPGVDKRLLLIEPTDFGHTEHGVIGYESYVAKVLGVSRAIADERVRVLRRRDDVGRTGVYLTHIVEDDESFEAVAKKLSDSDPALRRTIKRRE